MVETKKSFQKFTRCRGVKRFNLNQHCAAHIFFFPKNDRKCLNFPENSFKKENSGKREVIILNSVTIRNVSYELN